MSLKKKIIYLISKHIYYKYSLQYGYLFVIALCAITSHSKHCTNIQSVLTAMNPYRCNTRFSLHSSIPQKNAGRIFKTPVFARRRCANSQNDLNLQEHGREKLKCRESGNVNIAKISGMLALSFPPFLVLFCV
jgi:hypothetical protein